MVSDPPGLRSVIGGKDGVAAGLTADTTLIEMSTVGPDTIGWLKASLPEGATLLDAPVLGSISEAESGSLVIFVGGPDPIVERWKSLFRVLGSPTHVGPVGAGAAAKLVANLTLLGSLGLLGEALLLARSLELPQETAFEVLSTTPLAAQADRRRPSIEGGDYPARFSLALAHKDAGLMMQAAASAGGDLPIATGMQRWFERADAAGLGEQDYSAVLAHILGDPRP